MSTLAPTLENYDVLVLPGWRSSGPAHWQSRWENLFPGFKRVEQNDWLHPKRQDWINTLERYVDAAQKPVLLIAHSLGVATVAHWAHRFDAGKIAGALLVAPADVERVTVASALKNFGPLPKSALPFPSLLVASSNDPCCTAWRAALFADLWAAELQLLGAHGHINADSDLGDWTPGLELLERLLGKAQSQARLPQLDAKPGFRWVA